MTFGTGAANSCLALSYILIVPSTNANLWQASLTTRVAKSQAQRSSSAGVQEVSFGRPNAHTAAQGRFLHQPTIVERTLIILCEQ